MVDDTTSLSNVPSGGHEEILMIGDKQEHFQGKTKSPSDVQSHIGEYLKTQGFTVQTSAPGDQGVVIQAKKGGFFAK